MQNNPLIIFLIIWLISVLGKTIIEVLGIFEILLLGGIAFIGVMLGHILWVSSGANKKDEK